MFKRPRIGVLSTGDELRDPVSKEKDGSSSLEEGQIWDSNRLMLIEMFKERGFEVWNGGIVRDRCVWKRDLIGSYCISCLAPNLSEKQLWRALKNVML